MRGRSWVRLDAQRLWAKIQARHAALITGYLAGYPRRSYPRHLDGSADMSIDALGPEFERRFPVTISSKRLGETESGHWMACREITRGPGPLERWHNVVFVNWSYGAVTRAVCVPALIPAFVNEQLAYLYWQPGGHSSHAVIEHYGMLDERSMFRFARVNADNLLEERRPRRNIDEFAELIGPRGAIRDRTASDTVQILKGTQDGALRKVVDFR